MIDSNVGFKQIMFATAIEDYYGNGKVKVSIPDIFLENATSVKDITHRKGSISLYRNAFPPALSEHYVIKNYIELPIIATMNNVNVSEDTMYINNNISKGDKLLVVFPNENPKNGYIIGRC